MAGSEFHPPAELSFDGDIYVNFKTFKSELEIYFVATETTKKSNEVHVARLLNLIGRDARRVFDSLNFVGKRTVERVLEAIEGAIVPQRNEVMAHFKFFKRCQRTSEPFAHWYRDLKDLVVACEFGDLQDKLLRTQIVLGVESTDLQERLLRSDVELPQVVKLVQSHEAGVTHRKQVRQSIDDVVLDSPSVDKLSVSSHGPRKTHRTQGISGRVSNANPFNKPAAGTSKLVGQASNVLSSQIQGSRICGESSRCCSPMVEALLQRTVMSDVSHLVAHNFQSVERVLSTSSDALSRLLDEMVERSRNKTMHIFLEVYEKMGSLADGPVTELYNALWSYLQRGLRYPPEIPPVVPSADGPYLESLVIKFFSEMFPLVYHQAIHPKADDFNDSFKTCLKNNMMEIKPFAKIPETMAKDVASSFEATKVLLEALSLGVEGISRTNKLIERTTNGSDSCREALLRLHHCPKCQDLKPTIKPCNGYCLNVMRGCLTQLRVTDLDLPWSNFLSETLDLVKEMRTLKIPSIDKVLERMYIPVSDAIMVGSLEGPRIQRELNSLCGRIAVSREDGAENSVHPSPSREVSVTVSSTSDGDVSPFWRELDNLRDATDRSKASGFYANLAEVLCSDDSFAETRDTSDCWNGHRIGEYTKELVRPGLDAQKYNPEMKWTPPAAVPDVEEMAEKLRHMRQVVASRLSPKWAPEAQSQVAYDASGSGDGSVDPDDGYPDAEDGSGSGDGEPRFNGPIVTDKVNTYNQNKPTVQGTGGCGSLGSTISITLSAAVISLLWTH